jgi:hypothetical protein
MWGVPPSALGRARLVLEPLHQLGWVWPRWPVIWARLGRDDTPTEIGKLYPHAGPLLAARWNEDLISDCWPDLLRMGGSLKYGQASRRR